MAWTLCGYFFLLTSLQHLLKPVRNAFFLSTAGSINLPWVFISTAVVSAAGTVAYDRWVAPLPRRRQILGTMMVVAATLVGFWLAFGAPNAWTAGAFYVWINVFSLLLVSQFFLIGNDLFDPRQAKRIFGFIGAGGLAGGVAGAAAAGFLAEPLGPRNLLLLGATMLVIAISLAARVFKISDYPEARPKQQAGKPGITGGLGIIRRVEHLRRIALLLFVAILVSTFVDWIFLAAVEEAIPGRADQTEFFGRVFAVFNAVALLGQFLLTGVALRTLGLAGTLAVLPIAMGAGVTGLLVVPGLLTATLARGADATLRNSIDQSAREILYLPIPTVLVQRAKPFIDIVIQRGADGMAGILILAGTGLAAFGGRLLPEMTLALIVLWGFAVWGVRQSYRRALERLLAVRDVDLEEAAETSFDSETVRDLLGELSPEVEAERTHYALDLLGGVPTRALRDHLVALLGHPSPDVRARAIRRLARDAEAEDLERIRALVEDPDGLVRAEAVLVLCESELERHRERIEPWLESDNVHELEAALVCLMRSGGEEDGDLVGRVLSRLVRQVGEEGAPVRAACARALGRIGAPHPLQRHLETLLSDSQPEVVRAAIESAGRTPRKDLIPSLLPLLEPLPLRPATISALAAYGEGGIPYFAASLRDPELSPGARRWLPSVFVRIGTRAAFQALAEGLPALSLGPHRLYALKALNKMRRRHPGWSIPVELIRQELEVELRAAYDVERQRGNLGRIGKDLATEDGKRADRLAKAAGTYAWALGFQGERAIERAFRLQALLYSPRTIYFAYAGVAGGRSAYGAHALELLEEALGRQDARRIVPLIDPDISSAQRVEIGRELFRLEDHGVAEDIEAVFEGGESWLQAYAVGLASAAYSEELAPELAQLASSGAPEVRTIAALSERDGDLGEGGEMAVSSVEKAAALRRTELLGELGADDLLQLAAVAEEREFENGEFLYYEGEEGDYLYVVLEGEVLSEKGGQEIIRSQPGQAVGTFSILDQEPRSASAVATKPTRTLAIHRADLAQILADNYSLVEGLFSHLTGIIRGMNERVFTEDHSAARTEVRPEKEDGDESRP